jgi:hypothetical protein
MSFDVLILNIFSCFIIWWKHFEIWSSFYIKDQGVFECKEGLQIMQMVVTCFMLGCG